MKSAILTIALSALSTPAFAADLTFDQIKEACSNPGQFQNQIAPTNLQITCQERVTKWLPHLAKQMALPNSREITASLTSDKYQVAPNVHPMDVAEQYGSCPSFKQILETTNFTKATSCEELLEFNGTEEELCAGILEQARIANPKMVLIEDTGRIEEFCTENGNQRPRDEGKDQGKNQGDDQGKFQGRGQGKGRQ